MALVFEWDARKAVSNERKHGVGFAEAASVFGDPRSVTIADTYHSDEEDRWVTLGLSHRRRLIVVVHTARGETIRIIGARPATAHERKEYERGG